MIAAEARGFLLGPALALELGAGLRARAQARQAARTRRSAPSTCSSTAPGELELHTDARRRRRGACSCTTTCSPPAAPRAALCELVEQLGGEVVGCGFLIELAFLERARAPGAARRRTRCSPTSPDELAASRADRAPQPHDRRARAGAVGADRRPPPPAALVAARRRAWRTSTSDAFTEVMRTAQGQTRARRLHARARATSASTR